MVDGLIQCGSAATRWNTRDLRLAEQLVELTKLRRPGRAVRVDGTAGADAMAVASADADLERPAGRVGEDEDVGSSGLQRARIRGAEGQVGDDMPSQRLGRLWPGLIDPSPSPREGPTR